MATPDTEADLTAQLVRLFPSQLFSAGPRANVFADAEHEAGAVIGGARVPREAWFCRYVTERQLPYGGGQARWLDHQLLQRFERGRAREARTLSRQVYDALHNLPFTGASGTRYLLCVYIAGPSLLTDTYYSHNLSLLADV
jgi:hypothetical protein